ncbi:MAG: hypothetical protein V1744_05465 [Candidatus Altiarchaeota archaeon]
MKTRFILVLMMFLASWVSADFSRAPNPYFRITAVHEMQVLVGGDFVMRIYGADGRESYGAKVSVYSNGVLYYSGLTGVDGVCSFKPIAGGKYVYTIDQGRYFSVGGEFDVIDPNMKVNPEPEEE